MANEMEKKKLELEEKKAVLRSETIIGCVGTIAVCLCAFLLKEPQVLWGLFFVVLLSKIRT